MSAAPATQTGRCPDCDGPVRTEEHETVCTDCGLVLDDDCLDYGPDWRGDRSERSRGTGTTLPTGRHDGGLGSTIGWKHEDAKGRTLSGKKRRQLSRLRTHDSRAQVGSKRERNQITGLTEIKRMASSLGLPHSVREQACTLFTTAQEADLLPGRSIEGVSSAALYAAARLNSTPRTLEDIAYVSQVDRRRIARCYQLLNRELELPVPPNQPLEYLPQLTSVFDIPTEVEQHAAEVLESMAADNRCQGHNPAGVAASVLYLATNTPAVEQPTQQALGDEAGVSPVTIRSHFPVSRDYL